MAAGWRPDMSLLVTGAAGFVGLNIVEAALARGEEVVALSLEAIPAAAQAVFAALPGRLHAVRGDVLDASLLEDVLTRHRPRRMVPAAALTPGGGQEAAQADRTFMVNVVGVLRCLQAAARHGVGRIVYPSSGAVYGANAFGAEPLDEQATPPMPETIYAISKLAAERTALRLRQSTGLDLVAARLGTVFGPWERDTGVRETLSPHLQIAAHAGRGIEAVLPGPGRRDWIYVRDIAAAILALLDSTRSDPPVVNVAPGIEWSMEAWCEALARRRPGFRWRRAADGVLANVDYWMARDRAPLANARLTRDYGFTPRFGLEVALDDFLAWQASVPVP